MRQTITLKEYDDIYRRRVLSLVGGWASIGIFFGTLARHKITPLTPLAITLVMTSALCLFVSAISLRSNKVSTTIPGILFMFGLFLLPFNSGIVNGGLGSPASVGFVVIPISAALLGGHLHPLIGYILSAVGIISMFFLERLGYTAPISDPSKVNLYKTFIYLLFSTGIFWVAQYYIRFKLKTDQELYDQRIMYKLF